MSFYEPRHCRTCDKKVHVTVFGTYRRHYTTSLSGQLHLCPASGCNALTPAEASSAPGRRRA